MARNYYYLVAGLREYSLDTEAKGFDAVAIRDEICGELAGKDRDYLRDFYTFYDVTNILSLLGGKENFNALGNFSREELEREIQSPSELPKYISDVLVTYRNAEKEDKYAEIDETIDTSVPIERTLWVRFYDHCARSGCKFIREWYGFDMELRNISAAYMARKQGRDMESAVVGESDMTVSLTRSSAVDFGLKAEIDYLDKLIQILEEKNMLEKERRLDMLKWDKADELAERDYFNINKVLAYCAKINIIHRWMSLDQETGEKMFRMLIESLTDREILEASVFEQGVSNVPNMQID